MASAVETLREHAFEARDKKATEPRVQEGSWVKVGVRGERFWCKVRYEREDGCLIGVVDNELLRSPWRRGDEIVLQCDHVLQSAQPQDELTFRRLLDVLGSASEAAMVWRDVREASGVGMKAYTNT